MKPRIYILGVIVVILILAVGSCRKAGTWLVKSDNPEQADVMVVLMGSISDRVLQTADLYNENIAGKVWMVEPESGAADILEERGVKLISQSTQVCNALISLGIPTDSIVLLPGNASSTRMEVEIISNHLMSQPGIESILVVSSAGHTRRAFKLFRASFHSLNEAPVIYCSTNPYTDFNAEKWWKDKDHIEKVVGEYVRLVNYVFFERPQLRRREI